MSKSKIPSDLRRRLEQARLDNLALIRAIDRLDITADEMPQRLLRELFELDADCAEALWALDQPAKSLNFNAMLSDTFASLEDLPVVRREFLEQIPDRSITPLQEHQARISSELTIDDAYRQVPGRDPEIG